ncbi:uncharacterized protein CANTADRAFT_47632 [Suhomyces tanzawaensis NRRL Y-17324]|uniref:Uncharacterized protein n=1 Tax=Suhomyces tanzawaensis NRRL Y-17324 TaxID=984487 RepID=A0A1E4SMZ4_9ASCO|nr:uncharacterized protein CANTADRAFT_47632 [Suhomyces tanzawaensis NRRL Y-17324]ODV80891.1 hypothetical protein CANTADRAFT_47632 [Suhomyces tanzawaensis NRRL Y-17324]
MLSDDESQELLAVSATSSHNNLTDRAKTDALHKRVDEQSTKTNTLLKKTWEFFKHQVLGRPNEFEQFVLNNEPNDSSLIAKYTKVVDIDLTEQPLLVDSVTLNTIHIPHPLVSFMRNEKNQVLDSDLDIVTDLKESPILVFIHGLGGQMSQFEPLMGLLSQCLEIVSLDLPGFGNSRLDFSKDSKLETSLTEDEKVRISSSVKKMSWEDFQTDNIVNIIYEFIRQNIAKGKRIVLIGHSMGTHLSIKVAKKLPSQQVEGLILLSPPGLTDDVEKEIPSHKTGTVTLLKFFTYFPFFFNAFRCWDRLEGLNSTSVLRQLGKVTNLDHNIYVKLRQFRWNMDVHSDVVLKYASGFRKAKYSELLAGISKFNDNALDKTVYEKTLLIGGTNDGVTPVKIIHEVDAFLTKKFDRKVSSIIEVNNAGHSLLLNKPELISGMILNHVELKFPERLHLSPAWVLKVKAKISGDKWGLKNELKWLALKPISSNIGRDGGRDVSPLLGMKTLREGDANHSPTIVEQRFYGNSRVQSDLQGTLVAIVDISADIPPYSPKSFKHIQYYKCSTVSKVVPDQVAVRRFIQLIDDILSNTTTENPLVAVHCHYGFNRTGYLICCYLIERLGWTVQEAVDGFKDAKFPGIKHPHFIDGLYVRYEG